MWHNSSNSANGNRVFKSQFLYGTRVYKTRDTSLQNYFKRMLTYYIVSPHYASLQITSL